MCGISGYIVNQKIDDSILKKTLSLMKNRGPDSQNTYKINFIPIFTKKISPRNPKSLVARKKRDTNC